MAVDLPPEARCVQCGYSLRALVEPRCPECGHPFDPADPQSYRLPHAYRPRRPWLAPLSRADLRHTVIVTIVAIAVTMVALPPYYYFESADERLFLLTIPLVFAAHLARMRPWLARLGGGTALLACTALLVPPLREWPNPHLVLWIAFLLAVGGSTDLLWRWATPRRRPTGKTDQVSLGRRPRRALTALFVLFWVNMLCPPAAPCTLRLWVSMPFLSAKADEVLAAGRPELRAQWIGCWKVDRVILRPGGGVEFLTRPDDRHTTAIAYCPPTRQGGRPGPLSRVWPLRNWHFYVRTY